MFILLHGEINIFILRQPCNYRKKLIKHTHSPTVVQTVKNIQSIFNNTDDNQADLALYTILKNKNI